VPLPEPLLEVGSRVVAFFEEGGEPPYLVYQYLPRDEYAVRRELGDLRLWLGSRAVRCQAVSLADLFWQALEGSSWLASLIEQEHQAAGDPTALEEVYRSVGEVLRESPTLPDRVVEALQGCDERTAAFLYRAGALYPAYRTSALLDDLRARLRLPVTLLYPGRLVGSYGLRFMDRCDPAYGYRAHIIPRGGAT
jgi:BREX protein BrxB